MAEINNDDRKLGDEWSDWDGDVSDQQIITSRKPFLLISLLSAIILVLVLFVFWYLIHPRIISFGKSFAWIAGIIITASSIFFLTIVLYIIVLATSKRRGCPYSSTVISGWLFMFYHVSSILGKRFGITNDYMGHSFLKVSNTLTKKFDNRIDSPQKILFLLPRCLEKTVQKEITELSRINNCRCFVLSGGNAARNKIKELVPQAIIAIACERDLVSGLIDISGKIPVVAIPNVRPEGPCKNTKVNMNDVEEALNYFLSKGQN